jgi:glycosyltransferase involved in cell wall biosynthesis
MNNVDEMIEPLGSAPRVREPLSLLPVSDEVRKNTFRVSLVIPALNEAVALRLLLRSVSMYVDEVIVVDGNSTDGTAEAVRDTCARAVVIGQTGKGKGDAIKAGLAVATGDIIVTMDADGSMSMDDVDAMVECLAVGYDFVKGSRVLPGAGSNDFTPLRQAGNSALTWCARILYGADYTDITYGINAYWRLMICNVDGLSDGFEFEIQAAIRAARGGLKTMEVPCFEQARVGGASKLSPLKDGWRILRVILGEAHPRRRVEFRSVADLYLPPSQEAA